MEHQSMIFEYESYGTLSSVALRNLSVDTFSHFMDTKILCHQNIFLTTLYK